LDVPIPRWLSVIAVGVLGGGLAAYGVTGLAAKYENFLLLVSYWIAPWLAIVVVDFYGQPGAATQSGRGGAIGWAGVTAFVGGLACSVPFMSSALYVGALARRLHGADLAYYVGMGVAGTVYYGLQRFGGARGPGVRASA
jgi:NCS1 family nucleobase:cation symporter-1